jgi:F420-dependent oxidoreductase-like protein
MEIRLLIEPQFGATYEQQRAFVLAAEELGFPAVMRSDHVVNTSPSAGLPGPTDAWVTLGALARETRTIRLGTLMTSAHFRSPALLAVQVAQVDNMSAGRIELGLGAGWFEREHAAFGFPFPSAPERLDRLEEQLTIITGVWDREAEDDFSFEGQYYRLVDCPRLPRTFQVPHVPIIVGGGGRRRTPELAAAFASEFNVGLVDRDVVVAQFERVRAACEFRGRDPESLVYSTATTICCGEDEKSVTKRLERGYVEPDELRAIGIGGSPDEVVEWLLELKSTGAQRCYLRLLDIEDLEQIELIASAVVPAVEASP